MERSSQEQDTVRIKIQGVLNKLSKPMELKSHSIYRVPQIVRDSVDRKYYEPKLVSIGPYHRKKDHLRAMEEHKHLYLHKFLDASEPQATLQDYIDSIRAMEDKARSCYFESPVPALMSSDEFVEMLLVDGCFILQFFIEWLLDGPRDPILSVAWMLPHLHNDLLMLENQIPFFVIQSLYDIYCYDPERPRLSQHVGTPLIERIAQYFGDNKSLKEIQVSSTTRWLQEYKVHIDHLLHLYHCYFITAPTSATNTSTSVPLYHSRPYAKRSSAPGGAGDASLRPTTVPSAKELIQHGVSFRPMEKRNNNLDVTFSEGIIEMQQVSIDVPDCSRYMNLVAFEMSRPDVHKHFTSYVGFMDYLIDTPDDVLILKGAGIMECQLSSAEEVSDFFNQLSYCSYINYESHYLGPVYADVNAYCRRKWPRYKAALRRDYLSTPWAVVAFSVGILFACFTIFNTVISILQTFFHLSK